MRKLEVSKKFVDNELKKELIKEGKSEEEAKKMAVRQKGEIFESKDIRASILLQFKDASGENIVKLVEKPNINNLTDETTTVEKNKLEELTPVIEEPKTPKKPKATKKKK